MVGGGRNRARKRASVTGGKGIAEIFRVPPALRAVSFSEAPLLKAKERREGSVSALKADLLFFPDGVLMTFCFDR